MLEVKKGRDCVNTHTIERGQKKEKRISLSCSLQSEGGGGRGEGEEINHSLSSPNHPGFFPPPPLAALFFFCPVSLDILNGRLSLSLLFYLASTLSTVETRGC